MNRVRRLQTQTLRDLLLGDRVRGGRLTLQQLAPGLEGSIGGGGGGPPTIPGGTDTQVQFNDGGAFGGSIDFTFGKTLGRIVMVKDAPTGSARSFVVLKNTSTASTASTSLSVLNDADNALSMGMQGSAYTVVPQWQNRATIISTASAAGMWIEAIGGTIAFGIGAGHSLIAYFDTNGRLVTLDNIGIELGTAKNQRIYYDSGAGVGCWI